MFFIQVKDRKENKEKQSKHSLIKNKYGLKIIIDKMVTMGFSRTLHKCQNKS